MKPPPGKRPRLAPAMAPVIDETGLKKARTALLRLLGYRQQSRREAEEYLRRKGCGDELIAVLLEEMERWGYIDDRRYAEEYIDSCLRRGLGPIRARHTLIARGIDRQLVERELACRYPPEQERSLARRLLERRIAPGDDLNDRRWLRRQAAYLLRRGFHERTVTGAIRECRSPDGE